MAERALLSELPSATGLPGLWEGASSPGWGEATSLRKLGLVAIWRARARCPAPRQAQERRYRPQYIRKPRKLNFQVGSGPPEIVDQVRGCCAWSRDSAMAEPGFWGRESPTHRAAGMVAGVLGSPLTDPLHLSLPRSAQNLCGRRKVVGRTSPEFFPAWVINQGFPEDSEPPPIPPPPLPAPLLAGEGAWTRGPCFPRNWGGGRTPASAPARRPRLMRTGRSWRRRPAAGEKGAGRRACGSPWERGQSPSCGFCALFRGRLFQLPPARPPYGRRRRAPRRGPRSWRAGRLAAGPGRPPSLSLRGPKFAACNLPLQFRGEWDEWFLKSN